MAWGDYGWGGTGSGTLGGGTTNDGPSGRPGTNTADAPKILGYFMGEPYYFSDSRSGGTVYQRLDGSEIGTDTKGGGSGPAGVSSTTVYNNSAGSNQSRYTYKFPDGSIHQLDSQDPNYDLLIAPGLEDGAGDPSVDITTENGVRVARDRYTGAVLWRGDPATGGGGGYDFSTSSAPIRYYDPAHPELGYQIVPAGQGAYGTGQVAPANEVYGASSGSNSSGSSAALMAILNGTMAGNRGSSGSRLSVAAQNASGLANQGAENEQSLAFLQAKNNLNLQYQQSLEAIRNSGGDSASQSQLQQQAWQAWQNGLDRAQRQEQLDIQQAQAFQQAMSSTDPGAFGAFMSQYGTIGNGLNAGGTALSDAAILPAAMLQQGSPPPVLPGAGGGAIPPAPGGIPANSSGGTTPAPAPTTGTGIPPVGGTTPRPVPLTFEAWKAQFPPVPDRVNRLDRNARERDLETAYSTYLESMAPPQTAAQRAMSGRNGTEYLRRSLGMPTDQFYTPGYGDHSGGGNMDEAALQAEYAAIAGPRPANTGDGSSYAYQAGYQAWVEKQMQQLRGQAYGEARNTMTGLQPNEVDPSSIGLTGNEPYRVFENPTGVGYVGLDKTTGQTFDYRPGTDKPLDHIGANGKVAYSTPNPLSPAQGIPTPAAVPALAANTQGVIPYGNDQIINGIPQTRAAGGMADMSAPIVVGEPRNGKPNPEMLIPMGGGKMMVRPVTIKQAEAMQRLGRGMATGGILSFADWSTQYNPRNSYGKSGAQKMYNAYLTSMGVAVPTAPAPVAAPVAAAPAPAPVVATPPPVVAAPAPPPNYYQPAGYTPTAVTPPQYAAPIPTNPTSPGVPAGTGIPANGLPPVTQPAPVSQTSTGAAVVPPGMAGTVADLRGQREATPFQYFNPYAVNYETVSPTQRQTSEFGLQTSRGIPVQDLQAEWQRFRLPGVYAGSLNQGL